MKRMAFTTVCHHICVVIFMFVSLQNDYQTDGICQSIVIYAIFSDFAYLVNLLLASRFMNIDSSLSMYLSIFAGLIYFVCCCINWSWQVGYLKKLVFGGLWSVYLYVHSQTCLSRSNECAHTNTQNRYIPMLAVIIRDDLVLLKWLYDNAKKKRGQLGSQQSPSPSVNNTKKEK